MIFSFTDGGALSPLLYAEAFGTTREEAEDDIAALLAGGALPLTLTEGGVTLSQWIALPIFAEGIPLLYLYALATLPASRGQGCLRTLLEKTAKMARGEGYHALLLLPATPSLAEAYARMGFTEARPAGGAPVIEKGADLALLRAKEAPIAPMSQEEAVRAFAGGLSAPLLDYTLKTLAPAVLPYRAGDAAYLLLADAPRYALAARGGDTTRQGEGLTPLLLRPLGGALPREIPEPLPR